MTSCATSQGNGSVNGRIASAPHPQPVLHALTFIAVALCVLVGPWPVAAWAQSAAKPATPAQLEAKRKCPDGPYSRCGELIGPYAEDEVIRLADKKKIRRKELPPHERTFGGVRYKIPHSFAQVLDPTGETSSMVAYWIPLAHMADGSEAATRAEASFTLHNNKVWVRYMFQTEMFPYWKEIHRAVLNLIQSWEQ